MILAYISTRGRYDTTLAMAMLSVALQTRQPDKFILYDDNDYPRDLRTVPIFLHIFKLFDEKGTKWEIIFGQKKGQHYNHQTANRMGFDLCWRLDDDEYASENVLAILEENMAEDVGAVGGIVVVPQMALTAPPAGTNNSIGQFLTHPNLQWFRLTEKREVDHLYSSFLYRAGIAEYNLNLSRVAHTEETQFTYELKRHGYKNIIAPTALTYHFREPTGGIRDGQSLENWQHDERIFQAKLTEWGVKSPKLIVLDNGIGDHIVFKKIMPEVKEKYGEVVIACVYPFVFEGEATISIADAKGRMDIEPYNIYKWCWDRHWRAPLEDAYRAMYL